MKILLDCLIVAAIISLSCAAMANGLNPATDTAISPPSQQPPTNSNTSSLNGDTTGQNLVPNGWTVNTGTQGQLVYTQQDSEFCKGCPSANRVVNGQIYMSGAG